MALPEEREAKEEPTILGEVEDDLTRCNILVIGSIGDGKSTLIKALLDEDYAGDPPDCKTHARGVTKECNVYPLKGTNGRIKLIDTPGVGDHDAKLSTVVPKIEKYFLNRNVDEQLGVDGVILACCCASARITMGVQIAAAILKMAIYDQDGDAREKLIVAGTKADKEDELEREEWMQNIGPMFSEKVGGPPGYVVLTKCRKTARNRGEDDVQDLLNAIYEIRDKKSKLNYKTVDADDMLNILAETTGLEATTAQLKQMKEEIEEERAQIKAQQEKMKQELDEMRARSEMLENAKEEAEKKAAQLEENLRAEMKTAEDKMKRAEEKMKEDMEALKISQKKEAEAAIAAHKNKLAANTTMQTKLNKQYEDLQKQLQDLIASSKRVEDEKDEAETKAKKRAQELEELERKCMLSSVPLYRFKLGEKYMYINNDGWATRCRNIENATKFEIHGVGCRKYIVIASKSGNAEVDWSGKYLDTSWKDCIGAYKEIAHWKIGEDYLIFTASGHKVTVYESSGYLYCYNDYKDLDFEILRCTE